MNNLTNTPEVIAAKNAVAEELSVIRLKLLNEYPFIGSISMKLEIIPIRDIRIPTACTDGTRVFVDVAFFESLSPAEKKFLFAHEVWHCVLMHMIRKQSRDISLFNIATDKEINYLLKNDGFTLIPDACYPDFNEEGLSAEQIYEKMLSKNNNNPQSAASNQRGNQFDKHVFENSNLDNSDDKNSQDNKSNHRQFNNGKVSDKYGDVGLDDDYQSNPATVEKDFADKMKENIISSAMEVSKRNKGSLPSFIEKMIDKMLEPEFNWKELLSQYITKINLENKSWTRVSRRHIWEDAYVQGKYNESLNIACLIDTSGSCSSDLEKFLSELNGLIASFGDYNLTLIECDSEIHNISVYDNSNPFPIDDINKIKLHGGGGSDFRPAFDKICQDLSEDDSRYSIIVAFTDGYIDVPKYNQTGKEIIWVLSNKSCTAPTEDYGVAINFDGND